MRSKATGFTLVELMIVIAVIAVILAFAIPSLMSSRISAREAAAIQALRSVTAVQMHYRLRFGAYARNAMSLQAEGYVDGFKSEGANRATRSGYRYFFFGRKSTWSSFCVSMDPTDRARSFYVDQRGVIRFSTQGVAGPTSPPLD